MLIIIFNKSYNFLKNFTQILNRILYENISKIAFKIQIKTLKIYDSF